MTSDFTLGNLITHHNFLRPIVNQDICRISFLIFPEMIRNWGAGDSWPAGRKLKEQWRAKIRRHGRFTGFCVPCKPTEQLEIPRFNLIYIYHMVDFGFSWLSFISRYYSDALQRCGATWRDVDTFPIWVAIWKSTNPEIHWVAYGTLQSSDPHSHRLS